MAFSDISKAMQAMDLAIPKMYHVAESNQAMLTIKMGPKFNLAVLIMYCALESNHLSIKFNPKTQTFTVLDSSKMDSEKINEIFARFKWICWHPRPDNRDRNGNIVIDLYCRLMA